MPLTNQSFLDLELCEEVATASSNIVETEIIDLNMIKEANCGYAVVGGKICYTITITNNSAIELVDVVFRDPLPNNLTYVEGSFTVDDDSQTPIIDANNVLSYTLTIPSSSTLVIKFCTTVGNVVQETN